MEENFSVQVSLCLEESTAPELFLDLQAPHDRASILAARVLIDAVQDCQNGFWCHEVIRQIAEPEIRRWMMTKDAAGIPVTEVSKVFDDGRLSAISLGDWAKKHWQLRSGNATENLDLRISDMLAVAVASELWKFDDAFGYILRNIVSRETVDHVMFDPCGEMWVDRVAARSLCRKSHCSDDSWKKQFSRPFLVEYLQALNYLTSVL
ncbi:MULTISPECIES: hypothetical protein [Thalassospira]|uniref:Uncharacterized protein n=1 Tax=Thalassospira aquimaris TaxID=3037796 RepID=A0ABT6G888_9PROT|nr:MULTISPECIES: hypothetical protein [Thalassospira]MDG4718270.1 hypothetical protein [Thalassospira sp. FZY0004]